MESINLVVVACLLTITTISAQICANPQVVSFRYTGAVQTFTVPSCVTELVVDAAGARGGDATDPTNKFSPGPPGLGARVQENSLPVSPGQQLFIYVGGAGVDESASARIGGFNGGGKSSTYVGTGGGGASDVRADVDDLEHRILVAGGGGGGGASFCGDGRGGHSGLIGESAPPCVGEDAGIGGGGGTQESGGSGGEISDFLSHSGSLGLGAPSNTQFGGGGGGGFYGGGGGGIRGGGGGSSYSAGSSTSYTTGFNNGKGYVDISYCGC